MPGNLSLDHTLQLFDEFLLHARPYHGYRLTAAFNHLLTPVFAASGRIARYIEMNIASTEQFWCISV
jgi:hypothetical protein